MTHYPACAKSGGAGPARQGTRLGLKTSCRNKETKCCSEEPCQDLNPLNHGEIARSQLARETSLAPAVMAAINKSGGPSHVSQNLEKVG